MTRRLACVLLALVPAGAPAAAAEDCYAVESAGGAVTFRLTQAGSPFSGGFRRFGGTVCYAEDRMARIDVWLDPASVDAGLPEIDAALKDKEFFAVREHPRIAFSSAAVQAAGELYRARGTLEIKGQRREVEIAFRAWQEGPRRLVAGAFALDRLHYGIGSGEWSNTAWLGAEVKVDFKATLSRRK